MTPRSHQRIAILGGGAAGFFSAVNIAEKNPDIQVTLFEATQRPLQKVLISGGGRCNVTHACFDPRLLVQYYPRGAKELRSVFSRFQPQDTVRWFTERGLKLKREDDGRMFPVSDCSQDVADLLLTQARRHNVRLMTGFQAQSITTADEGFLLSAKNHPNQHFDTLILATGYSPPGWSLARALGHTVIPPVPSLFPFKVDSPVIRDLQGISVPAMAGRLKAGGQKFDAEGDMLITHTGLSGPLIYRLSAAGARTLAERHYQAELVLDFVPTLSEESLREKLQQLLHQTEAQKQLHNTRLEIPGQSPLSQRLWQALLLASGADPEARADTTSKKTINRLVENLKRLSLPVNGKSPSKEEFVSCGGVARNEVNFQTMESRRVPNLFFAGEILDIDALTGGFNFQACWSEGWVISEAITARNNPQ